MAPLPKNTGAEYVTQAECEVRQRISKGKITLLSLIVVAMLALPGMSLLFALSAQGDAESNKVKIEAQDRMLKLIHEEVKETRSDVKLLLRGRGNG